MVAAPLRLAALQRVGYARNTFEIESYTSMVLGRGKYGRELHSGSLVANHGSRPYATTLICPEICPKDIKYWYRVLKYGFGCLLRSGLKPQLQDQNRVLYSGLDHLQVSRTVFLPITPEDVRIPGAIAPFGDKAPNCRSETNPATPPGLFAARQKNPQAILPNAPPQARR